MSSTQSHASCITAPLLAHWPFDEGSSTAIIADIAGNGPYAAVADREMPRVGGVHGDALDLRGAHAIRVDNFGVSALDAITLAA